MKTTEEENATLKNQTELEKNEEKQKQTDETAIFSAFLLIIGIIISIFVFGFAMVQLLNY